MAKSRKKPTKPSAPREMVFEHVPEPQKTPFDVAKDRVIAAIAELNGALQDAHGCAEMRVFLRHSETMPMQFSYEIYRLQAASFTMAVTTVDEVKHQAWRAVSGEGLDALRKKRSSNAAETAKAV